MKNYRAYSSLFQAVNPYTGKLKVYHGAKIIARSFKEAQQMVQVMGLEFLVIDDVIKDEFVICLN